ncbi:SulP family inorganic anion transporter [Domibacillus sp. PGB-M46]|uniref:SulP family inorganic anion transporter n=1 Tax=Domibacillus sp. PGB-M46 TaxID=2910255 RepID=UPI001F582AF7|nr:SulP family inorganic anion transporter [Domibacillus sp. PGB-M46]MCI2256543.1 SulP family inorganic anion transporter [Domibacillus sp. PGB-M46]
MIALKRFEGYSINGFQRDLLAGLVVGVVAIPLGMAFAIASGVRPEYGLYTTIIAGILVSLLGGSKFQIAGPTGAFVPILFAVVSQYGYENLLIAGFMAGILLLLAGLLKAGRFIKFIPRPVTIGFTAGIAVIIFSGQIANFLGLRDIKKHEEFHLNMIEIILHIGSVNPISVLISFICLGTIILMTKYVPKIPGPLAGLLVSSAVAFFFFRGQVETIGTAFGAIPGGLPAFEFPAITWETVIMLLPAALVIAALGGIESLLSAVVADNMSKEKHHSNKELVGQGIANMVTPLFGGIPATGAIARTATNIKNGAASPLSGIVHGLVVLLVVLLLAPYASHIPMASMAPILMFVAWNMSERKEFRHIVQTKSADSAVLIVTFLLTVFTDLTTGVGAGLLLALLMFVVKMSRGLKISKVLPDPEDKLVKPEMVAQGKNCPQIGMYTIEGPLFFGSTEKFEKAVDHILKSKPKVLLLRMSNVSFIDTSGEALLVSIANQLKEQGGQLLLSGLKRQPKELLSSTGFYQHLGEEYFFDRTGKALNYALARLNTGTCLGCKQRAFKECAKLSKQPAGQAEQSRKGLAVT